MTIGLAFWIIMLVLLVFGIALHMGLVAGAWAGANNLIEYVLFGLLGWGIFGAPLRR